MAPRLLYAVSREHFARIVPPHVRDRIAAACDVIPAPVPEEADKAFVLSHVRDAEILVSSWGTPAIDAEILAAAPALKLVAHAAGTIKPMMSEEAWRRGVRVTGSAQAIATGVAEFCLCLIVAASKRVFWLADRLRTGFWSRTEDLFGTPFEIYRQRVGIIGASFVGRELVRLLRPQGCTVVVYDPYWSSERIAELGAVKAETLDEIFGTCRVVSLNAPTTKETERMIRGKHFAALPDGAVFVNTARGILIDQDEMVGELRRGRFVACLDVTTPEPLPIDHPLRRLPNVVITPHIAGAVVENLMRIGEFIAEDLERYAAGRELRGEVTRDRLDTIA
jgi:phosphoglycerate dehydrogenase-like enzyme